jgi:hypothetical protein
MDVMRSSRPLHVRTLRPEPSRIGKLSVGFWVIFGFFVGIATSIGARVLLCPQVEVVQPAP